LDALTNIDPWYAALSIYQSIKESATRRGEGSREGWTVEEGAVEEKGDI
jgi:hypothetical protein